MQPRRQARVRNPCREEDRRRYVGTKADVLLQFTLHECARAGGLTLPSPAQLGHPLKARPRYLAGGLFMTGRTTRPRHHSHARGNFGQAVLMHGRARSTAIDRSISTVTTVTNPRHDRATHVRWAAWSRSRNMEIEIAHRRDCRRFRCP